MTQKNMVLRSVEDPNGVYCVDLFQRPDHSFGFQVCRRDPENGRGWAVLGNDNLQAFKTLETAKKAALDRVPWLDGGQIEGN